MYKRLIQQASQRYIKQQQDREGDSNKKASTSQIITEVWRVDCCSARGSFRPSRASDILFGRENQQASRIVTVKAS